MDVFELDHVIAKRSKLNKPYLEFLHVPSLSAGLYVLPAGAVDTQSRIRQMRSITSSVVEVLSRWAPKAAQLKQGWWCT